MLRRKTAASFLLINVFQVDIAAANGAAAVLIYPDPEQRSYPQNTPLYGHVSPQRPLSHQLLQLCSVLTRGFSCRSTWARGTPTPPASPPLIIPSSPQLSHPASQRSQRRPSPPVRPPFCYSKCVQLEVNLERNDAIDANRGSSSLFLGLSAVPNQLPTVALEEGCPRWFTGWEVRRTSPWRSTTCWSTGRSTTSLASSKGSSIPVRFTSEARSNVQTGGISFV